MDAVFGLPRKKSSGCSYRDPLYKDVFFSDQLTVDEFVNNYENPKTLSSVSKFDCLTYLINFH